jgi:hypothetical protein
MKSNTKSGDSDFVSIRDPVLMELRPLLDDLKQIDLEEGIDWNSFGPKVEEKFGSILREMTSSDWDRLAYLLGSDSARFTEYVEYLKAFGQLLLHETSALKIGSTTLNQVRLDLLPRILACKEHLMYFAKKFERLPHKAKRHFCYKMLATFLFTVVDFFLMIYAFVKDDGPIPVFCEEMVNMLKYPIHSLISDCEASLIKFPSEPELDELGEIGRKLTFFGSMIPKLTVHRSWTDWCKGHNPTLADIPVPPKTDVIKKIEESTVDHKWQKGEWVRV